MSAGRRLGAVLALVGVLCLGAAHPTPTEAAWVGAEVGTGAVAAGNVAPVTQMTCTAGLLQPVIYSWTAPTGGTPRTGYRWTVTGAVNGSGTLPASATSVSLSTGVLGIGSGSFSLVALSTDSWQSTAKTGSLSFAHVVLDVLSTCSVP